MSLTLSFLSQPSRSAATVKRWLERRLDGVWCLGGFRAWFMVRSLAGCAARSEVGVMGARVT